MKDFFSGSGKGQGKGTKPEPKCKYCNDDGGRCARCGTGMAPAGTSTAVGVGPAPWQGSVYGSGPSHGQNHVKAAITRPPCDHRALTPVVTLRDGQVTLYGAQGHKLADPQAKVSHLDMILDLAGLVKPRKFVTAGPRRITGLNALAYPEVVSLHWPDMTAPNHVSLTFWQRLLDALPGHVAIACVGSHGRTGTCMACLMVADGMDPESAIAKVREVHCARAIETTAQESYIKALGKR